MTMLSMVCRRWNDLVISNKLWQGAYFMERNSFLGHSAKGAQHFTYDERKDYRKQWKKFYNRKIDASNFEKLNMIMVYHSL